MKKILTLLSAGAAMLLFAENPRCFPEYTQILKIRTASSQEAQDITVKARVLPEDKTLAFSTRWDDSNPKHKRMSELLNKHHFKGTYYLTDFQDNYFTPEVRRTIVGNGDGIGAHTLHHPNLPSLNPNKIFYEIAGIRPKLEASMNCCVTAFTLPFCSSKTFYNDHVPFMIGNMLFRAGLLGGPEWQENIGKDFGLDGSWFGSILFNIDDREPKMEAFQKAMKTLPAKAQKAENGPKLTMGMHTWHTESGFAKLDKILAEAAGNPAWWYCTETDYIAYRYQYLYTGIRKIKNKGDTAVFEIRRIAAPDLGSDVPLWIESSVKIASAELDGKKISVRKDLLAELPQADMHRIPKVVDSVELQENKPARGKKDPALEVRLALDPAGKKLVFEFRPEKDLKNIELTLRLPPYWKTHLLREMIPGTKAGETCRKSFELGERSTIPFAEEGDLFYAVQMDYTCDRVIRRLHASMLLKRDFSPKGSPRDCACGLVAVDEKFLTEDYLRELSGGTEKLLIPDNCRKTWEKAVSSGDTSPIFTVFARPKDLKNKWVPVPGDTVIVLQFSGAGYRKLNLFLPYQSWNKRGPKSVWLNGRKVEGRAIQRTFVPRAGLNRLVLVFKAADAGRMNFSIAPGNDPHKPIEFQNLL